MQPLYEIRINWAHGSEIYDGDEVYCDDECYLEATGDSSPNASGIEGGGKKPTKELVVKRLEIITKKFPQIKNKKFWMEILKVSAKKEEW